MVPAPSPMVGEDREEQEKKAELPTDCTEPGMEMPVSALQEKKAESPMRIRPSFSETLIRAVQPLKAEDGEALLCL